MTWVNDVLRRTPHVSLGQLQWSPGLQVLLTLYPWLLFVIALAWISYPHISAIEFYAAPFIYAALIPEGAFCSQRFSSLSTIFSLEKHWVGSFFSSLRSNYYKIQMRWDFWNAPVYLTTAPCSSSVDYYSIDGHRMFFFSIYSGILVVTPPFSNNMVHKQNL